jgi:hypothetical protein
MLLLNGSQFQQMLDLPIFWWVAAVALARYNLQSVRAYLLKEDFQQLWNYESTAWVAKYASATANTRSIAPAPCCLSCHAGGVHSPSVVPRAWSTGVISPTPPMTRSISESSAVARLSVVTVLRLGLGDAARAFRAVQRFAKFIRVHPWPSSSPPAPPR